MQQASLHRISSRLVQSQSIAIATTLWSIEYSHHIQIYLIDDLHNYNNKPTFSLRMAWYGYLFVPTQFLARL